MDRRRPELGPVVAVASGGPAEAEHAIEPVGIYDQTYSTLASRRLVLLSFAAAEERAVARGRSDSRRCSRGRQR